MGTTANKLATLLQTKANIKSAIIKKGQEVSDDTPFSEYADKILNIESGGGLPDNIHTISITVNEEDAGTVTGEGTASDGMYVKIEAHPIFTNNFCFSHWSENGVEVSRANPYYFTVTKNRNLVANFTQMYDMPQNWFSKYIYSNGVGSSVASQSHIYANQLEYNSYDGWFYFRQVTSSGFVIKTKTFVKTSGMWNNTYGGQIQSPFYNLAGNFSIDDNGVLFAITNNSIVTYNPFTDTSSYLTSSTDKLPDYSAHTWCNVIHAKGLYVISSEDEYIAYSIDGKEWTMVPNAVYNNGENLKFLGGKFISWSGYRYSWSDDGINWIRNGYAGGGSSHTPTDIFWDGKNIIVVGARYIDVIPNADFSKVQVGTKDWTDGKSANNLSGGFYGAGWYVFFRISKYGSDYATFLYGKTPTNLVETESMPISTSNASAMVGAYGDGKMLVIANNYNVFLYSRPEGPGL